MLTTKGNHYNPLSQDYTLVESLNARMNELDASNKVQFDQSNFNFQDNLCGVFREVADPFDREIKELRFERNPNEPSSLTKTVEIDKTDMPQV